MKTKLWLVAFWIIASCLLLSSMSAYAQKLGYINSQKVMATYKEAQDAQERLDKISQDWEAEARAKQKQFQDLGEQLESQKLLLSEERMKEKQQELQTLYTEIQKFQAEKFGQGGELYKKQEEIMQPIIDKINAAIKKLGEEQGFDYIFDSVAANIVYASPKQPDLTDQVLEELEKGLQSKATAKTGTN